MLKTLFAAALAAGAIASAPQAALAQTVEVIVLQLDQDPNSLEKDTQIQNGMLIEFQKVLNSPNVISYMHQFGIQGMDVFGERALVMQNPGYDTTRTRRSEEELLTLLQQIPNFSPDAAILYTVYARAVEDPYTRISLLQATLQYRVFGRDGRFLGGDNMALDTRGIPLTGCATAVAGQGPDPLCVRQAVTENVGRLAQDAANKIALQLAALIGPAVGSAAPSGPTYGDPNQAIQPTYGSPQPGLSQSVGGACANLPATYVISFEGVEGRQKNAIEEFMASWECAETLETVDDSFTTVTYRYKTSADRGRILRNIRQMADMMGIIVETGLSGNNEIRVETIGLRRN